MNLFAKFVGESLLSLLANQAYSDIKKYSTFPNEYSLYGHVRGLSQRISIDLWVKRSFNIGFSLGIGHLLSLTTVFNYRMAGTYLCSNGAMRGVSHWIIMVVCINFASLICDTF